MCGPGPEGVHPRGRSVVSAGPPDTNFGSEVGTRPGGLVVYVLFPTARR